MKSLFAVVKALLAFVKKKYDFQKRNIQEITDVKEQIWPTNVKYLGLSTEHFMDIIHMYVQFPKLLA